MNQYTKSCFRKSRKSNSDYDIKMEENRANQLINRSLNKLLKNLTNIIRDILPFEQKS